MTGNFSLIWEDFHKNMSERFQSVLQNHEFVDITLVSQDSKKIQAHKVILGAGSAFFKEVLTNNSNPHHLIYLKGVDEEVLHAVVDFLYQGQVEVRQEVVQAFMATARDLKVEGLHAGEEGESCLQKDVPVSKDNVDQMYSLEGKHTVLNKTNETKDFKLLTDVDEMFKIKSYHEREIKAHGNARGVMKETFYMHCKLCEFKCKKKRELKYHHNEKHSALGTDIRNIQFPEKDGDGRFPCPMCEKTYPHQQKNVVRHVKEVHLGILYYCQNCEYSAKSTTKVGNHFKSAYLGEKWNCDQCDYEATLPGSFYAHRKQKHSVHEDANNEKEAKSFYQEVIKDPKNVNKILDPLMASVTESKETYSPLQTWKPLDDDFSYYISCSQCKFECKKKKELDWHMQEKHVTFDKKTLVPDFHRDTDNMYPCYSCSKRFDSKSNIRRHVQEVHLEIINKCPNCDYTTKQKQKLKYHFNATHLGMTWDCDQCTFQGSYPDALYLHRKTHM